MKRKLTFMLTALLLLMRMSLWSQQCYIASIDLSEQNFENAQSLDDTDIAVNQDVTLTFHQGTSSNPPKYYNMGSAVRCYAGNYFTVTTSTGHISTINLTFGSGDGSNEITTDVGAFDSPTWIGENATVNFTIGGTSGHRRINALQIMYCTSGIPQETVSLPTFSPEAGTYFEAQSVSINCATEGATIFYTLDGTNPTESSTEYVETINITETTTVKALAVKEGYLNSNIASATYIISTSSNVITIAEARALDNNEYALVQGVVTFIDGRNVYIQDETAGIDLYLNNNTVPSELALGDLVQAYGKRATYNGLAELSGINGNDDDQFSILSSDNTLPLVVKTIAEILEGGADALQCTRVKVESATIGAINTSGNTPLTQDGVSINIYKVPSLTDIEEGDVVDVVSVIGYFNVPQLRVALASDIVVSETPVIPDPVLTLSVSELNDFSYIYGSGPSEAKSFTISGSNLTSDITLTAPEHYELSLNPEYGYFDNDELSPVDGILSNTTVYVRLKAGLNVGTYSGNLTVVSGDLSQSVALNGTVDEPTVTLTIAEARALENGQFAQVEGTVIFIDGRNVYIQDETAGIDLYLNSNTVPESLAIGDIVSAYGSKTVFKGLVELSEINGSNPNEFSILSSGNQLPLDIRTIENINTDFNGANLLQSTRVKIENVVIGTINPSGTTVISQDGNDLNVYRIPNVEGLAEGDQITITGIVGCYNTPQLRVASATDIEIVQNSNLTVSPMTLSGFEYEYESGGPSEIQFFTIGGNQLTHDIAVIPSENFEVSILPNELFQPEDPAIIYIPGTGSILGINIYVRLKAGLEVGTYTEQIAVVSEDSNTLYVTVSGTVTNDGPTPPPTPTEGEYIRVSDLSQLVEGAYVVFASRFDENTKDYYAMSNSSSGKPTGVPFSSTTNEGNEILPASITVEESNYYWIVGVTPNGYTFTNAAGELIGYTSSTNFSTGGDNTEWNITIQTSEESSMVPNYTGYVIANVNNAVRAFALNSNHNFGPYHTQNMGGANYNFFLDLFVKAEGIEPPTPTVATPTFTPAEGTYYEAQTVSITCSTEDATIYYNTVSENGPWATYTDAITVDETMTIWAYAKKEGYNDSPVADATYTIQSGGESMVTIFNQDWEGEMNGWTFVTVEGSKPWTVGQYQGNHYAYANGYNGGVNEQWCISPAFNINDYQNVILTFRNAKNYTGPNLELKYSTNYDGVDPTTASWWTFDFNMSPGSYTWVESGDIHISIYPDYSTNCYIAFKYTSTENEAAAWEVDDIMLVGATSVPNLTATPSSLSGFTHVVGEGPSASQYFTLSGANIGPAPGGGSTGSVIIQSMENEFEISFDNEEFTWQLYIDDIAGTLPPTPIYVRMNGSEVGQYSGIVNIYSSSSDQTSVSLSGTVTEPPVPSEDYVRISHISQLVAGNRIVFAARFDENATDYYAMSNAASGKPEGVLFTSTTNEGNEILPASILNEENNFYWTVNVTSDGYTFTNAAGDLIGYTTGTNFSPNGDNTAWSIEINTSEGGAMVPNYTGFVISNVNYPARAFALNGNHNFGPYHTQNMGGESYNFFLDIFMQGEGGVPPTPTVATPTFSPAAGTYYETQDVTISCTTTGASIYYSLDSENGPWEEYEDAITVDESMTIWAYAMKEGYNDSPVVNAEYIIQDDIVIIFNQDWEDDWNGWTEFSVEGDDFHWNIASYQGNHYAYMNGYSQGTYYENEDWLISPAFDLDSYSDKEVMLTFRTATKFDGPILQVYFSNNYEGGDPYSQETTWTQLDGFALSLGNYEWVESGPINLDPTISGTNCHIAFKYASTNEAAAAWEVDDIMLTANGSDTPTPTLIATPNTINNLDYTFENGPSVPQSYTLTGSNLEGEGYITVTVSGEFEILNDDGNYSSSPFELHYSNGVIDNQPVTITVRLKGDLAIGSYSGSIDHNGGGATTTVNLSGTVLSENEPMMTALMPLYIQGNNGSNNNRVPLAVPVQFANLYPNTTYHYTNQFVDENDGPETAGAGNVIYVNPDGFYRSTSPSLATEGGYGEFITDEEGQAVVWLMNEPTANARFTPGNHVYLRVRLNDGDDGTTPAYIFTSEDYTTVLNFGTEYDENQGTAFYVKSDEAPMSFAQMFAAEDELRPVYSTSIETIGVDYGSINQYADFYKEKVAGKDGWFGGIIPNVNNEGINFIMVFDMDNNVVSGYYTSEGQWSLNANTVNPTNGLDEPIFIDLTYDGVEEDLAANVKIWSADHEFVIENGDNAHYSMTVYNILGQPMMMKQINAGSTERISHSLASGVYVINVRNNQSNVSVKVIVK